MDGLAFEIKAFAAFGGAFAALGRAVKTADGQFDGLAGKARKFGDLARGLGAKMSVGMTLPVGAFLGDVTRTAAGFETSMNRVGAISQASGGDLERLTAMARKMGAETQFSAAEAADAMGFLAMAGFSVDKNMAALPGTLNLAAAGQIELADAADIASNVLTGYGLDVDDMARVVDVMVAASTKANTNITQLGGAMKYAAPLASAVGLSIEEATAAIGKMSDAGIQGEQAGVALRGALVRLLDPPKAAQEALDSFGVTVKDSAGKLLPLDQIIERLSPHLGDSAQMMRLFGQEAGPAMLALIKTGAPALRELTGALENSGGTAERVAKQQMEGFNGQLKALSSAWDEVKLSIADAGLLDAMTKFVEWLREGAVWFGKLDPETKKWTLGIAALAAALGPVVAVVGLFVAGIAAISAPVLLAVAGVAALAAGALLFKDDIGAAADAAAAWAGGVGDAVASAADDAASYLSGAVSGLSAALASAYAGATATVAQYSPGLADAMQAAGDALGAIAEGVGSGIEAALSGRWADAADGFGKAFGAYRAAVVGSFQSLAGSAGDWVGALVEKVRDAMVGRMGKIFDSVVEKIGAVSDAFFRLYDDVVGHSFVPDMVDGIRDEFSRLGSVMVSPAKDAAGEVSDTFDGLGKSVAEMLGGAVGAGIGGKSFDWRGSLGAIGGKLVTSAVGGFLDMRAATTPGTGQSASDGFGSAILKAAAGILSGVLGGGTAFAAGGVFTSPTAFSMGGSGLGVMAEKGPEAIMPLVRGPGGRLGVAAAGGGGGGVSVSIGVIDARGATDPAAVEAAVARAVAISTARIVPMVRDMRRDGMI